MESLRPQCPRCARAPAPQNNSTTRRKTVDVWRPRRRRPWTRRSGYGCRTTGWNSRSMKRGPERDARSDNRSASWSLPWPTRRLAVRVLDLGNRKYGAGRCPTLSQRTRRRREKSPTRLNQERGERRSKTPRNFAPRALRQESPDRTAGRLMKPKTSERRTHQWALLKTAVLAGPKPPGPAICRRGAHYEKRHCVSARLRGRLGADV